MKTCNNRIIFPSLSHPAYNVSKTAAMQRNDASKLPAPSFPAPEAGGAAVLALSGGENVGAAASVDVSSKVLVLVVPIFEVVVVSAAVVDVLVVVVKEEVSITSPVGKLEVRVVRVGLRIEAEEVATLTSDVTCEDAELRAEAADVEADSMAEAAFDEAAASAEDAALMAEEAVAPTCELRDETSAPTDETDAPAWEVSEDA